MLEGDLDHEPYSNIHHGKPSALMTPPVPVVVKFYVVVGLSMRRHTIMWKLHP